MSTLTPGVCASSTPADAAAVTPLPDRSPLRGDLRRITLAWGFGAAWMYIVSGATMQELLRVCHTPDWAFGPIGAIPLVAGLLQLPGGVLVERWVGRKRLFMATAGASRLLFAVAGLLPWVIAEGPWRWVVIALTLGIAWSLGHVSGPAWVSWMADVVPRRVRGRYFARRSQVGEAVGVATVLATGLLLDRAAAMADALDGGTGTALLATCSGLMVIAGVLGFLDIQCFRPIPDAAPRVVGTAGGDLLPRLRVLLAVGALRRLLAFTFTFNLACGMLPAYVYLFLREHVGLSMTTYTLCVTVVPMLLGLMAMRGWGRLIDRWGASRVLAVASWLVVLGPVGWFLVTPERFVLGYVLTLISPIAGAGVGLATFNLTLSMTGGPGGVTRKPGVAGAGAGLEAGPLGAATLSVAAAGGGLLSGLIGATLAATLHEVAWHAVLPGVGLGVVMTYHGWIFATSMGLRVVAAMIALRVARRA